MSNFLVHNKDASHETTQSTSSIKREIFSFVWTISEFGKFLDRKYEFSSPTFSRKSPDTSKWILTVFPENAYPQGSQVALRIQNASRDSLCYSTMYTVTIIDSKGKHHEEQRREKIFRQYLDYDECPLTSNHVIKEKRLLQNDDTLEICCKLDILVCDNPKTISNDPKRLQNDLNVATEKEFSSKNIGQNSNEYEYGVNSFPLKNDNLKRNNGVDSTEERDNVLNTWPRFDEGYFQRKSKIKTEDTQNNKNSYKVCNNVRVVCSDETGKSSCNLPGKIDSQVSRAREKSKLPTESISESFETLSSDLSSLFTTKYQCDVIIHTDDGQIAAHKAILAARSDYFRRTLMPEGNEIQIDGINTSTMNAILFYMYSGLSPQMTSDLAMDVLAACNTFHLKHLAEMAQRSLISQANVNNVTDILRKAKELKLDDLKISALQFIAKNRDTVTKTLKWNQMIEDDPHSAGEILLTIAAFRK